MICKQVVCTQHFLNEPIFNCLHTIQCFKYFCLLFAQIKGIKHSYLTRIIICLREVIGFQYNKGFNGSI